MFKKAKPIVASLASMNNITLFGLTLALNKKQKAKGNNIALENSQVSTQGDYHKGRADAYKDALLRILENKKHPPISSNNISENLAAVPLPAWRKNENGVVVFANDACIKTFFTTKDGVFIDPVGKTDFDSWPEDLAREFWSHDLIARETGRPWAGKERIIRDGNDVSDRWKIVKYGLYDDYGNASGSAGFAVPIYNLSI